MNASIFPDNIKQTTIKLFQTVKSMENCKTIR